MDNHTSPDTKQRTDYTEGSIFGSILKMGLPSMVGFLSHHIYHFADTWWVSRLPEKETGVAAITFLGSIIWVFFSFNQLVGPGSVAIISRRYGEKTYDLTEKAIKEAIVLKLFFGLIFGIIGYIFAGDILALIGAEGRVLEMGIQYGQIIFLGMPVMYATYSIFTGMRGVANPQMALYLMLGSNILNMLLDPIFMFGYFGFPALGIKGAAIASIISYVLTFALGIVLFYGDFTNVKLHFKGKESISIVSMWKMLKIGIPAWFGDLSFSSARLIIVKMVAPFGASVVAAYGVGNQVSAFGISILVGIGLGLSALIGHNLGGEKYERAKKIGDQAILLSVVIMLTLGLAVFTFSANIISLFFDNPQTISLGSEMLKILALGFPFIGLFLMVGQIHLGVGFNMPSMVLNIIHAWGLEIIPVYILTVHLGYSQNAIWWTITGAGLLTSMLFFIYYQRGRWLTYKI
ncbi:MAG: MATE family efflux transporter [candidate division Zixibacteria bacterium]|nr:MATE family efflux transporter [candidate division Zixibacteria bacterium]